MPERYDVPRSRDPHPVQKFHPPREAEPRSAEELARALFYSNDKRYLRKDIRRG